MKKFKLISIFLILTAVVAVTGIQAPAVSAQDDTIDFGYVQWPGVTVKTHVAAKIAEYLGYDAEMTSGSQAIVFKGLDTGDLDVFLGNWMPTMKMHFDKYEEKGSIHNVRVNLWDVVYKTAVPDYVYEAGVTSLSDLNKYAEKFNSTIYGIEPGNEGNIIIQNAIKNNNYNLKDWKLQASSTAGMLTAVKRAVNNKEWIAFNAWKPHYMNVMFDIRYLEDPEGIWAEGERVFTVVRNGFEDENPNYYKFLKQFKVTAPIQNKWIDSYKRQGKNPEVVAEEWIADNLDVVNQWVYGVETVDGRMARKAIKEQINN
ncbi:MULTISPECIES: ABC transporter substrate-binding protein [unclassified Halanaerobium]|uniref:ABC transporter substrate-binding protein n=1 Tax=unclassified Halanaerobium TaxID=2641197 RepID=UPI000DF127C3|nr:MULTISPECIES: ABC transporter substrate-binding protein [unclassified Halanaerobium]RCW43836.1 glycine betaine/proline transport system substrate-binding protein [Halanaerobium sp. MA284_MarDTE_T2]RCW80822.1 glycine betaine/proline transport system substrate-binding protein [Halanaerobium sp. DL-01]